MSEIKNLLEYDTASILLLRAMLWEQQSLTDYIPAGDKGQCDPNVSIELKVNGKEVSFAKFVNELVKTNDERIQQAIVHQLQIYTQFEKLKIFIAKLDDVERDIEEAIETMTSKELPWREPEYS